jgi:hypothetical protein
LLLTVRVIVVIVVYRRGIILLLVVHVLIVVLLRLQFQSMPGDTVNPGLSVLN